MAGTVTFKVSPAVAPYLGGDKPRELRLAAASGRVELPPADFVLLLYCLCHDADPEVKGSALAGLRALEHGFLLALLADRGLHPRILDALVQLHGKRPELAPFFAAHPALSEKAAIRLAELMVASELPVGLPSAVGEAGETRRAAGGEGAGADLPIDEAEFQSKYQQAQTMGVGEKIKTAFTGDKEWRSILLKDSNKLVCVSVIRNPRITEGEVLAIAKSSVQNDEIMRVICANKEWVKNPLIRKALAENNKTPLPAALRFVATLSEKDLSALAKNKNVSSVVASQARRILMTKKDGR